MSQTRRSSILGTLLKMSAGAALTVAGGALYVAWRLVNPGRVFVEVNIDASRQYEQVWFRSAVDHLLLHGLYMRAAANAPHIILCHGYSSNLSQCYGIGRELHALGYGVLLFDFRGAGQSSRKRVTVGWLEKRDLVGAVDFLRGRIRSDTPIGVLGYSMGGAVAIMAAAENRQISAVVTDSAYAQLDAVIKYGIRRLPTSTARLFGALSIYISERMSGYPTARIRPLEHVANVSPTPLLLIHGMDDSQISYENALALYEHAHEPRHIWLVDGAGHCASYNRDPQRYVERIHGFFQKALVDEREAVFGPA
ncbi:MAG: alpha/beta hydrolase [Dehalococcoidia bacterium]